MWTCHVVTGENLQSNEVCRRRDTDAQLRQQLDRVGFGNNLGLDSGRCEQEIHDGIDGHEWGAGIPVTARAPVPRPAPDVWPLLSTGPGIEKWVAHVERFDGEVGGMFRLTSKFQGREIVEEGRIEELTPESRMVLSWEWVGEGWGGPTRVEFLVESEPPGSSVLIVHTGFDRIAPEHRLAARKNYVGAWPEVLGDLRRLLAPVAA